MEQKLTKAECKRTWLLANPEKQKKHRQYNIEWNKRHSNKRRAIVRRWYWKHRESILTKQKAWKHKTRKGDEYNSGRRARLLNADREDCASKIAVLKFERFCRWCCEKLNSSNFSIDHIIPLSRGGHHIPDNLAACCFPCNASKNAKLVHEWLPTRELIGA